MLDILNQKEMIASPDKIKTALSGTGPYKIASWTKGQRIVLERNDNYWGTKPPIKTVNYRFIQEDATPPDMIFTFHNKDIYDADRTFSTYVLTTGPPQTVLEVF